MTTPDVPLTDADRKEMKRIREVLEPIVEQTAPSDTANPFTADDYQTRLDQLRAEMVRRKLDAVILSSPESQCWLHGYQTRWYRTGSTTEWPPLNFTVVTHDRIKLIDSKDHQKLVDLTSHIAKLDQNKGEFVWSTKGKPDDETEKFDLESVHQFVVDTASGGKSVDAQQWGIEQWTPRQNYATTVNLIEKITAKNVSVVDVSISMRRLQRLKTFKEVNLLRSLGDVLDNAYNYVRDRNFHPHTTELELWAALQTEMSRNGGESAGLHNTVALTRNYYHALSSTRPIGYGQIHFDPSAVRYRYHVNTARQFWLSDPRKTETIPKELVEASKVAADALEIVKAAQNGDRFADLAAKLRTHYTTGAARKAYWEFADWCGGYQLGISFTPDWVGEFVWNVNESDEKDNYKNTFDPDDGPSDNADRWLDEVRKTGGYELAEEEKTVRPGLVTNFESYVGGAGFIDTIIFHENGAEVLSQLPRTLDKNEIQEVSHPNATDVPPSHGHSGTRR